MIGNRQQILIFAMNIRKIGEKSNFLLEIVWPNRHQNHHLG